ncbi:MAG: hypothetical protein QG608_2762 [Actinomycetota bacterium]|nr:hypothetical protein [Actinomycetota bacterium]
MVTTRWGPIARSSGGQTSRHGMRRAMKTMTIAGLMTVLLVPTALIMTSSASPDPVPDPSETTAKGVEIVGISPHGSGCPAGTAHVSVLDTEEFEVSYDGFVVDLEEGPGTAVAEKFCQLLVEIVVPDGQQIAIKEATYRGDLSVGAGVTASLRTLFYFAQTPGVDTDDPADVVTLASSPVKKEWSSTSTAASTAWSSCGGSAYFNAKGRLTLRSTGPHDRSRVSLHTTRSAAYPFETRSCTATSTPVETTPVETDPASGT